MVDQSSEVGGNKLTKELCQLLNIRLRKSCSEGGLSHKCLQDVESIFEEDQQVAVEVGGHITLVDDLCDGCYG